MRASSQSTSFPSIQIFCVFSMGIVRAPLSVLSAGLHESRDGVADLGGGAGDLLGRSNSVAHASRGIALTEEIEHHRGGDDGRARVGLSRPGNVGRRAVHWLEQRRPGAI